MTTCAVRNSVTKKKGPHVTSLFPNRVTPAVWRRPPSPLRTELPARGSRWGTTDLICRTSSQEICPRKASGQNTEATWRGRKERGEAVAAGSRDTIEELHQQGRFLMWSWSAFRKVPKKWKMTLSCHSRRSLTRLVKVSFLANRRTGIQSRSRLSDSCSVEGQIPHWLSDMMVFLCYTCLD